jgi:hypothetical protein
MRRIKHSRGIKHNRKARSNKEAVLIAAPQLTAAPTGRIPAAEASPAIPDRAENVQAWESLLDIGAHTRMAALQWWRLWTTPWWLATRPPAGALASTPTGSHHAQAASKPTTSSREPIDKRVTGKTRPAARRPHR